ncbi:unnamed protein product [Bursaphelenchus okinawaensis]|uniref:Uncharacterized protein n=1 Tax=Bursaphelenchus okinawaensis TaxID=465554 RepID=A0A811K4W9_9BILA|nr:unnamed protein product [Bursaphelenchus okinawaensis]CAG9091402.1 unnamed protein product [Bursaphelenchus okinawaensis]
MKSVVLLLLLFSLVNSYFHYNKDNGEAQISGMLTCKATNFEDLPVVKMKLWEDDNGRGAYIDGDDLLGEFDVAPTGEFAIFGREKEYFDTEFYIQIHHTCGGKCRSLDVYQDKMANNDEIELENQGDVDSGCNTKTWAEKEDIDNESKANSTNE